MTGAWGWGLEGLAPAMQPLFSGPLSVSGTVTGLDGLPSYDPLGGTRAGQGRPGPAGELDSGWERGKSLGLGRLCCPSSLSPPEP